MKKIMLSAALTAVGSMALLAGAGSALALGLDYYTGDADDAVYQDTGAEYVYLTDLTEPASAPMIQLNTTILSEYEHDYIVGIFNTDGMGGVTNTLNVLDTFEGDLSSNIIFDLTAGTATAGSNTSAFETNFGFFIRFYDDVGGGILTDEIYYSDPALGTGDVFNIFHDPLGIEATGFSEVALGIGGPNTDGYALISVDDVSPIPEPTTMLLFGAGLAGLAGVSRRKK